MRKLGVLVSCILVVGVVLVATFTPLAPPPGGPPAYAEAPGFVLEDTWGDKVRLADFRGKIVVLHFWAEWCASCKVDLRYFQSVHETYSADDLVVLGLAYASGDRENVRRLVDSLGVAFQVAVCDEETRNLYEVASFPTNFVIDRHGKIRYVSRRLMNPGYWEQVIGEMIAESAD